MARSNIFEAGAASVAELFADYVENAPESGMCIALALSAHPLGDVERDAISKSLDALGYGRYSCTYATLLPCGESAPTDTATSAKLDAQALFLLIEGLDPLCIVASDAAATRALGEAYRCSYEPDGPIRVFGRPAVAYESLRNLLATDEGKRKAWRIFKSIPKRP